MSIVEVNCVLLPCTPTSSVAKAPAPHINNPAADKIPIRYIAFSSAPRPLSRSERTGLASRGGDAGNLVFCQEVSNYGSWTPNVSLKRFVQLARPTVAAR